MPTYRYRCPDCGFEDTKLHGMTKVAIFHCPQCSEQMTQLISGGAGVHYKGSGFYINDSKKPRPKTDVADHL